MQRLRAGQHSLRSGGQAGRRRGVVGSLGRLGTSCSMHSRHLAPPTQLASSTSSFPPLMPWAPHLQCRPVEPGSKGIQCGVRRQ